MGGLVGRLTAVKMFILSIWPRNSKELYQNPSRNFFTRWQADSKTNKERQGTRIAETILIKKKFEEFMLTDF